MALEEHDREDLLRDGRTMRLRGETVIEGVPVVVGFRSQGQLSLYCGPDPVFQFNAARQLRRVFFQGRKFAAENGHLVELVRESRGGRVEFVSQPVDHEMQSIILASFQNWLAALRAATPTAVWRLHEDDSGRFHDQLGNWLGKVDDRPEIAAAPNA